MVVTLKEAAMYQIATPDESPAAAWDRTLYAFLAEKERRSGSLRTVQSYSDAPGLLRPLKQDA
jgi:hypothetical protein